MLVVVASKFSVSSHFRRTNTHSRYGHKCAQSFHQGEIELKCKKRQFKGKTSTNKKKTKISTVDAVHNNRTRLHILPLHKQTLDKQTLHKQTLRKQTLHKQTLH